MDGQTGAGRRAPFRQTTGWLVILTLAAYLAFGAGKLWTFRGDVSGFVVAGERFFAPARLTYPIMVEHSDGYDGQFYYRLALDPATTKRTDYGITIDTPPVRAQRIVYPVLAWLVSGGRGALVPYAMVFLNLAGLAVIAWLGCRLAARWAVPPRYGLLLAFYPGFVLSLARDTTEIVATAIALTALLLATSGRTLAAILVGVVAVLTRETTLLYLAGFGLVEAWRCVRLRRLSPVLLAYLLPPLAYVGWQVALLRIWGMSAIGDVGPHDLAFPPLVHYAAWIWSDLLDAMSSPIRYRFLFGLVATLAVGAFVAYVGRVVWRHRPVPLGYLVPWLLYAALASLFTGAVWGEPYGYLRTLNDLYVFGIVLLFAARDVPALRRMARCIVVLWLGTVVFAL